MNPFDLIVITVFLLVQWRITALWLAWARKRLAGTQLGVARAAIFAWDGVLVVGYVMSISDVVSRLGLPGRFSLMTGGLVLCYLLIASGTLAVQMVFAAIRKRLNADVNPGRRRVLNAAGNVMMAAPLAVMGYGSLIQRTDFHVREVDIPVPNLPKDLEGLKVLQISDIHLSAFLTEAELTRVIDAAAGLRSNLTVITGDLISTQGDPLDACIRQLARLKADAGVFGCMGNHEKYAHAEDYAEQAAARVGIRFLRRQTQQLRFGDSVLNLAGVDYQSTAGKKLYLHGAESMLVPGACNVLLSHNPDVFPVAARQGYNLMLSGHTHGGQVTVEILDQGINPARFVTPFVYGLYRSGNASAYVTRGIGTIGIPTRIGARPEISLLRLRKA